MTPLENAAKNFDNIAHSPLSHSTQGLASGTVQSHYGGIGQALPSAQDMVRCLAQAMSVMCHAIELELKAIRAKSCCEAHDE